MSRSIWTATLPIALSLLFGVTEIGDYCDRAALVIARRFSSGWRPVGRYPRCFAVRVSLFAGYFQSDHKFGSKIRN